MANKNIFSSATSVVPRADARNEAGGLAYRLAPKHALAQLAATGCFNGVFYASAEDQLTAFKGLVDQVEDNVFLAKLALYSREKAYMKDMPAALLLVLSKRDPGLFRQIFDRVVDNGRVLRTLFQMLRSGQFGRKSLSYALQKAFQGWLNRVRVGTLLSASIGNDPSLRDVLRLARPTPVDNSRRAFFGWLTDRPVEKWTPASLDDLPCEVRDLTAYRQSTSEDEQVAILEQNRFRWDLLADSARGPKVWKAIARQMGSQALRMNLNTLLRHDVLGDAEMVKEVVGRLADPDEVRRSRQFPYQFLSAYLNAEAGVPQEVREALGRAAEVACDNVPALPGPVVIGLDVSGSMSSAITGQRGAGATSKMRCVDVAALFAAAVARRNPGSLIVPFDTRTFEVTVTPGMGILQLAEQLARFGGGGTDCSLPLKHANAAHRERPFAGCVLVSDMEGWVGVGRGNSTPTMTAWHEFLKNQARLQAGAVSPKLIAINLQANTTAQAPERFDILNVGGFSDSVFNVVASFLANDDERFVTEVEAMEL